MHAPLDSRLLKSFILLVETGSITETSRRIGRSQPAVSLQIQRLRDATGVNLFTTVGRKLVLTSDGELLLGYARTILNLQEEVQLRLSVPKLTGHVVLGIPDLYAACLLPSILSDFYNASPQVEIELKCMLSSQLMGMLERDEIDLALLTGMRAFKDGDLVAQEHLVWVTGESRSPHEENPVPLAVLPPGNVFRDFALAGLEKIGRKWRISCVSASIGGLHAAILGGTSVGVVVKGAVIPGMRQLSEAEGYPTLPRVDIVLHRSGKRVNPAADAMADIISQNLARSSIAPTTNLLTTQAGSGSHE